ncbi:MAG: radical SAM protein [Candidatus Hydrogenedentes bacterium]|nr:radical SAM protein [Candidatus Hydrogenedentota bacterium]
MFGRKETPHTVSAPFAGANRRRYTPRAGHPDLDACLAEAQTLAADIRPLLLKDADLSFADRCRDRWRKVRALRRSAANYLVNRGRYKGGNHALRPLYVIWTMCNSCNFRCNYCDNHQGRHYYDMADPGRLDTGQGKRLLDVMITGTPAIYWCGGEPMLRSDLPELLDHAWRLGYFPNMINTNGSLVHRRLQDPAWRKFLWQMDIVIVSLDALDTALLSRLWGVDAGRQVLVNLLLLRELRRDVTFKLAVNTVITPETIMEARAVFDLACDLDVWFVPVPVNFKHRPEAALLDSPAYREFAELILARKREGCKIIGSETLLRRLLYAEPHHCLTALKPHVWSNGAICWPCRAAVNVAPVDINLLDYQTFDEAYAAGRERIAPDHFHGKGAQQCGGDCAWMQNYTTSRYLEGLTHPVRSGFLQELREFAVNRRNG